jgi:ribosome-binding factor A
LNSLLDGEVSDRRLGSVRVTRVELSRDGSRARAWFVLLDHSSPNSENDQPVTNQTSDPREIEVALDRAAGFLRVRLCEALPLKRMPDLRFRHDPAAILEPEDPALEGPSSEQDI